jgi:GNAT superfamily N-acetyltransferase
VAAATAAPRRPTGMAPAVYVFDTATCRSMSRLVTGLVCESFPELSARAVYNTAAHDATAHAAAAAARAAASCAGTTAAAAAAADEQDDPISELVGFHDDDACLWLVLCEGGAARGMAMLARYHNSMYISSLCVSPTHRGGGGGSLLLRSASSLAASLGLTKLSGSVDGGSAALRSFYTRLGAQHAAATQLSSAGAVAHSVRLEAPSGAATDGGVAVPGHIPTDLAAAWRQRQENTAVRGASSAGLRAADVYSWNGIVTIATCRPRLYLYLLLSLLLCAECWASRSPSHDPHGGWTIRSWVLGLSTACLL